jgi:hypothetical protein
MIVQVTDFTGKYELHTGMYAQGNIQAYIDKYEVRYLRQLLGVELCNDFIADLNIQNVPKSPNFLDIYNPFAYDSGYNFYLFNGLYEGTGQLLSDGIKEMLLGFIYFEYAKDLVNQMTPFGNVKPKSENSDVANTLFSMMYARYNEAITTYRAIQHYVRMNNPVSGQLLTYTGTGQVGTGYTAGVVDLLGGTGSGGKLTITAKEVGAARTITLTNGGSGYLNGQYGVIGGTGFNLFVNITAVLGSVVTVTIDNQLEGAGYTIGDVLTIDSGNQDATFTIDDVWIGQVFTSTLNQSGTGYSVGDILTMDGGNQDSLIEVLTVGGGDYRKFKGIKKSTAYWL